MNTIDEHIERDETLLLAAEKNYVYKSGDAEDLSQDLARVKHIKRLITRYRETGSLRDQLIANHIVVMFNVFKPAFVRSLLRTSVSDKDWIVVNTFLIFMQRSLDLLTLDDGVMALLRSRK